MELPSRSRAVSWTVLVLVSLVIAACGGGGTQPDSTALPPAQETTTAASPQLTESDTDPEADAEEQVVAVGLSADFGMFRWHVVEARLGDSFGAPTLYVSIDVENIAMEEGSPEKALSLETPNGVIENSGFGVTTDVAPSSSENGVYEFQVEPNLAIEESVLRIGREGQAQALIPLGGGEVVSLEPIVVLVDEVGTAEAIELRLVSVVVDWHSLGTFGDSADVGTAYLTAVVDITLGEKSRTAADTFELVLPGGETVAAEKAPNEVLDAGVTAGGLEVSFIVPDQFDGEYRLRLLNLSRFPEDAVAEVGFAIGK